jgi:hypothetical protein
MVPNMGASCVCGSSGGGGADKSGKHGGEPAAEGLSDIVVTWIITNFSRINRTKHYLDVFVIGAYKW